MAKFDITLDGKVPERRQIARLLGRTEFRPMPPAADRVAWSAVLARPWIQEVASAVLERAEDVVRFNLAPVRATDYLSFFRTGSRDAHNAAGGRHSQMVSALTVAECLGHKGRFLDALLDASWATVEETSWIMPPHLGSESGQMLPDAADPGIDLRVAAVGRQLAEMLYLLGPKMDVVTPMWRRRINYEIRRQVVEPYLKRNFWWETAEHNWNAVCTSGVVACALLADFDGAVRARVLHKALGSVHHFLRGFTSDGGCSEGPGYWAYGMGAYASLAYFVHCATDGKIDLLADPLVRRVFAYPPAMVLSGSKVANFADCPREVGFRNGAVAWAAEKAGVPEMVTLASRRTGGPPRFEAMPDLFLSREPVDFEPPQQAFLPDLMVLVARSAGRDGEQLVLAVKGGHNGETHNHNDVGTFIVHWRGQSFICDLGAGEYVKKLFSPERYDLLATRSRGHDVPLVNGVEQSVGQQFRATEFRLVEGAGVLGVSMELAAAYPPEAGLKSLLRRVSLHRGEPQFVEVVDEVVFAGEARAYELPLYTEGRFEAAGEGLVRVRGAQSSAEGGNAIELRFDPRVVEATVESVAHGDGGLARRFGPELSRCTLNLLGAAPMAAVRLRLTSAN